jgi:protease I
MTQKTEERVLAGTQIAILVAQGVEQEELVKGQKALGQAGAIAHLVSHRSGHIRAWDHSNWGDEFEVTLGFDVVIPYEFAALYLPGTTMPELLLSDRQAMGFVRAFVLAGKPIAAIGHSIKFLIHTGALRGRAVTALEGLQLEVKNAYATWVDQPVIVDHNLITGRTHHDLPVFLPRMVKEFGKQIAHLRRDELISN